MKIWKTFFTSLSILITALLTDILARNILFLTVDFEKATDTFLSAGGLVYLLIDLVIAVTFCTTVWLMLVWDAGDKIPPILMLLVGILGLVIHYLNIFTDLRWHSGFLYDIFNGIPWLSALWQNLLSGLPWKSAFWVTLFSDPFAYTLNALFIAFAIAGLLTKRNPK